MQIVFTEEQRKEFGDNLQKIAEQVKIHVHDMIQLHVGVPINAQGNEMLEPLIKWYVKYFGGEYRCHSLTVEENDKIYVLTEKDKTLEDYFPPLR